MLNIMKFLTRELKKFSKQVYNENATESAIFPYVIFNVTTSNVMERDREDVIIEIDIWDYQRDGYDAIMNVEILTSKIDKYLTSVRQKEGDSLLIFEKINRLSLPDEDSNVKRRQLRYVVKYYE